MHQRNLTPFFPTVQHDEGNLHADKGLFFLAELKLQSTLFLCWLLAAAAE